MKSEAMLTLLETAAEQLGVRVSYETLQVNIQGMRGGKCKVKGPSGMEWRIIIDKRATAEERVTTIATALSTFDVSTLEVALLRQVQAILRLHEPSAKHKLPSSFRAA